MLYKLLYSHVTLNYLFVEHVYEFYDLFGNMLYNMLCTPRLNNQLTFPIEYVKLRRTITPGCLFILDQKFSEQLQCLKNL